MVAARSRRRQVVGCRPNARRGPLMASGGCWRIPIKFEGSARRTSSWHFNLTLTMRHSRASLRAGSLAGQADTLQATSATTIATAEGGDNNNNNIHCHCHCHCHCYHYNSSRPITPLAAAQRRPTGPASVDWPPEWSLAIGSRPTAAPSPASSVWSPVRRRSRPSFECSPGTSEMNSPRPRVNSESAGPSLEFGFELELE